MARCSQAVCHSNYRLLISLAFRRQFHMSEKENHTAAFFITYCLYHSKILISFSPPPPFFCFSGLRKMFYSFNAAVLSVTVPVQGQLMYFVMPLNSQQAMFPHCVEVIGMFANQEESRACCLTCLCFISHHQALEGGTEVCKHLYYSVIYRCTWAHKQREEYRWSFLISHHQN